MKTKYVKIGHVYWCKVSGNIVPVRVLAGAKGTIEFAGWSNQPWRPMRNGFRCKNLKTGREFQTRSAARLRRELTEAELEREGLRAWNVTVPEKEV